MFLRLATILTNMFSARFEGAINTAISSGIQGLVKKGRQTLLLIMASFILSVLLSAGIIISILEASSQLDVEGITYFSSMLTWSLALSGFSLVGLLVIFWPRNSAQQIVVSAPILNHTADRPNPVGIEDLLAALVAEGINYIKDKNHQHERPMGHA